MRGRHLLSRPLACGACRRVFSPPLAARWAPISKAPLLAGARARSSVRSLGGDESAGESLPGHVPEWGLPSELKKTKVALHLGYDGSQYKGMRWWPPIALTEGVGGTCVYTAPILQGFTPCKIGTS